VKIAMTSSCPYQDIFEHAYERLRTAAQDGPELLEATPDGKTKLFGQECG